MNDRNRWAAIGRGSFNGRRDSERTFTERNRRNVDRIALRPIDNDAQCMRVSATFGNGRTRDLDIDRSRVMERSCIQEVDLPGGERNRQKIDLRCRAAGDHDITIEVLTRS